MRRIGTARWAVWLGTVGLAASGARAQYQNVDIKDYLGQRVVTTSVTPLKEGSRLIEKDGVFRVYQVDRINPGRLHIRAGGVSVWVTPRQVVLFDRAIDYFTDQIRRKPSAGLYNKRGLVWHELRQFDKAIADFDEALKREPRYALGYNNRGWSKQNKGDLDGALQDYDRAIELDGKLALAYANRGSTWQAKRDFDRAFADFDQAVKLDPESAVIRNNRGWARYTHRDFDEAIADLDAAIKLDPQAMTYSNRGVVWQSRGDYAKALADFDQAVTVDPRFALAYANKALLLSSCPDPGHRDARKAVTAATRACELAEWKDPRYLHILALASAETGDYTAALKWEDQAIELAPTGLKDEYRRHRERYRAAAPGQDGARSSPP